MNFIYFLAVRYIEAMKSIGYRATSPSEMYQVRSDTKNLGLYEYFDVEQWSWDRPGKARAADLDYLETAFDFYRERVNALSGEMSENWPSCMGNEITLVGPAWFK